MKYDRFFYLHIPKTGGTFFREAMFSPEAESVLLANGVKTNPSNRGEPNEYSSSTGWHWCWFKPFVEDNSYIYTNLRDPAKRIVSQFCWQAIDAVRNTNTIYTEEDINKENFYKWLNKSEDVYKNVQSKCLVYYDPDHSTYTAATNLRWDEGDIPRRDNYMFSEKFKNFVINKDELYANIARINFITKSEDLLLVDNQLKIINKILSDFEIDTQISYISDPLETAVNSISTKLFSEFTDAEIQGLYDYQDIDTEIYFSDIYTQY